MLAFDFDSPNIEVAEISEDKRYGKFIVEPLERGYGITLGNSLRRIMLASLPGAAVSQVKIDGVLHEFSSIPGVKEDVTEIIMNIKNLAIRNNSSTNEPKVAYIEFEGEGIVTAADIQVDSDIQILNPDLLNILGKPIVVYILDFFGMGLKAGLYIFIFRQFFRGLPRELEEAAHMDGCSFLRTLFSIIMPNAVPGIITVGVLSFVWNWNDTYYTNLFVSNKLNLMVKLLDVSGDPENTIAAIGSKIPASFVFNTKSTLYQGSILTAGSLLVILPLIVMYMFVQKRFVESASNAGIVG